MEKLPDIYPLTSLQIGDIQSYLSDVFIFFAPKSHKFLVLVDNRPWLMNKHRKLTQIWQLMVTKYRMSPFTNTRRLDTVSDSGMNSPKTDPLSSNASKNLYKWFSIIDAARWRRKPLFRLMDLRKSLHGFIVFEVAWKDVRGINYLNELQTDTSVALEVKYMRKWDFNSIDQALNSIYMWFSASPHEIHQLKCNLKQLSNVDASSGLGTSRNLLLKDSTLKASSEDKYFDVHEDLFEAYNQHNDGESHVGGNELLNLLDSKEESSISSTHYNDCLLSFRFNSSLLPFKLQKIVTSDLRLLTLLESGLPGWVLFFQSYPIFCHFYRPWMRPFARTLYILISLVTVIIGFYDLYKNVPLLKATASSLLGPLFDWVEAWDMISRIRYLGTMLFLQNFEKAVRCLMRAINVMKPIVSLVIKPLMEPLLNILEYIFPLWNIFYETGELYLSTVWVVVESSYSSLIEVFGLLLSPFGLLFNYVGTIAISLYPILLSIWEFLLVPIRLVLSLTSYMGSLLFELYELLKDVGLSVGNVVQLASIKEVTPSSAGISIWKSISKDLLSKIGECNNICDRCAEQMVEIKSLKDLREDLEKEKQELQIFLDMYGQQCFESRDVMEIKDSERRAQAQAEILKCALDEHSLELRVKAAYEAEAACQLRLIAAETEIADLWSKLDDCERKVMELREAIKIKDGEAETYIAEIETIGQAYEDMQTQNQHLLQQVTERDDYNIKLVSESVKAKQAQSSLLSEKQALCKQLQQINSSLDLLKVKIARVEDQAKTLFSQAKKTAAENRQLFMTMEATKQELMDAEKELKWLRSAVDSSDKEYEQNQQSILELQKELESDRTETKKLEEEVAELNRQVDELNPEGRDALIQKLQDEIKECKAILKCGVCFDRPKEVVITKCYHLFCNLCIQRNLEIRHRKCPGCGTPFGQNDVKQVNI